MKMFDNFKINYVWNQVTFNQAVMQISGSLSEYYLKNSFASESAFGAITGTIYFLLKPNAC